RPPNLEGGAHRTRGRWCWSETCLHSRKKHARRARRGCSAEPMHYVILFLILLAIGCDYLVSIEWLPGPVSYLQEVVGIVAAAYVVIAGARSGFRYVRGAYWLAFGAFAVVVVCGIVVNMLSTGPLFAGLRT